VRTGGFSGVKAAVWQASAAFGPEIRISEAPTAEGFASRSVYATPLNDCPMSPCSMAGGLLRFIAGQKKPPQPFRLQKLLRRRANRVNAMKTFLALMTQLIF